MVGFSVPSLTIRRPDDWHVHLRDQEALPNTVAASARHFARALVMPNLKPALTSLQSLLDYRQRILTACPRGAQFQPLMTFYLNEHLNPDDLLACTTHSFILGAKLYPAGATTNSEEGASSLEALYPLLDIMQERSLVLQIHAERASGDIFEREAQFIRQDLPAIIANFPKLRIVIEHVSSRVAVDFVTEAPNTIAATVTPHHLLYDRNKLLAGGLRAHYYCLPILKQDTDRQAILAAVASGNPKFFAGTDSAPHAIECKETCCASAGIYSAPFAPALYAQVFESLSALDKLEAFMSQHGADFYHQSYTDAEITLVKKKEAVPAKLPLGKTWVVPIEAGEYLPWSVL